MLNIYRHMGTPVLPFIRMALKEVIWDGKSKSWCVWYDRTQENEITKWGKAHLKLLKGFTAACNGAVRQTRCLTWLLLLPHCTFIWQGSAFSEMTDCCVLTALDSVTNILPTMQERAGQWQGTSESQLTWKTYLTWMRQFKWSWQHK